MTARVHLDHDGRARCGVTGTVTSDDTAVTCRRCLDLMAGILPGGAIPGGKPGVLRHDVKPHGTIAAYRRHYRRGEKPCRDCQQAELRRVADYRSRKELAA